MDLRHCIGVTQRISSGEGLNKFELADDLNMTHTLMMCPMLVRVHKLRVGGSNWGENAA
jgi:hypothetical protein